MSWKWLCDFLAVAPRQCSGYPAKSTLPAKRLSVIIGIETREFSPDQFSFKIRAALSGTLKLPVRLYYNRRHIDYA